MAAQSCRIAGLLRTGAGRKGNFLFDWERMLRELVMFIDWKVGWSGVREWKGKVSGGSGG